MKKFVNNLLTKRFANFSQIVSLLVKEREVNMKYYLSLSILVLCSCSRENNTIKIKGSDTEVNLAVLLAENFHEDNPEVFYPFREEVQD